MPSRSEARTQNVSTGFGPWLSSIVLLGVALAALGADVARQGDCDSAARGATHSVHDDSDSAHDQTKADVPQSSANARHSSSLARAGGRSVPLGSRDLPRLSSVTSLGASVLAATRLVDQRSFIRARLRERGLRSGEPADACA